MMWKLLTEMVSIQIVLCCESKTHNEGTVEFYFKKSELIRSLDMWIVPLLIAVGFGGIVVLLVLAEKDGF